MKKHRSVAYTLDFLALGFVILAIVYQHNGENQSRTTAILSAVTHRISEPEPSGKSSAIKKRGKK